MFFKGLLMLGFLAIFACQVSNAKSVKTLIEFNAQAARNPIGDLVDEIKEVVNGLNELLSGVITDAVNTLLNLRNVIEEIGARFLDYGIALVISIVGEVAEYIRNRTDEAAELGIDIGVCIHGREEQIQNLQFWLLLNLSTCVIGPVENVEIIINDELEVISQLVFNISNIPDELSKCLISLRPISCLNQLLRNITDMLVNIPGQISAIVSNALELVDNLPAKLGACLEDIGDSARNQTQQILQEIGECVDNAIAGATTTNAPSSTNTPASTLAS